MTMNRYRQRQKNILLSTPMLTHQRHAPAVMVPHAYAGASHLEPHDLLTLHAYTSAARILVVTHLHELDPRARTSRVLSDAKTVRPSCVQLEFGNVDFLDTHQLRQRLTDNASRVRTRVQQVTYHALC